MSSTIDRHHQEVDPPEERGALRRIHRLAVSQGQNPGVVLPAKLRQAGRRRGCPAERDGSQARDVDGSRGAAI
jgi:hypothetical protein